MPATTDRRISPFAHAHSRAGWVAEHAILGSANPRGEAKNAKSMAAQWWSMSPREKSIAIRDDADYFDGNGLPKDFSKDIWKASCNAPINVMPHYPPPGHHRGQGGDLTN